MANSIKALSLYRSKQTDTGWPIRASEVFLRLSLLRIGQAKPIRQVDTCLRVFFSCIGHSKPIRLADTSCGETSVFYIGQQETDMLGRYRLQRTFCLLYRPTETDTTCRCKCISFFLYRFLFGLDSSLSSSLCSKT
ncbi:unnamed protein product [Cochlearia groenlandica]